jgi:hypothetical protein
MAGYSDCTRIFGSPTILIDFQSNQKISIPSLSLITIEISELERFEERAQLKASKDAVSLNHQIPEPSINSLKGNFKWRL